MEIFKGSPKNRQVQDQLQGVDVPCEECNVRSCGLFEPFLTLCEVGNGTHFVGGKLIASGWTKTHLVVYTCASFFRVGEVFHKFDI